jgi:hypothetical protein
MSVVFNKDTGGTLNTGLVAYWRLNDLNDSVGTNHLIQAGNNGVPAGNDVTFHAGGKGLGFARFTRTSATIFQALRGNAPATTRVTDFTICAWVNIPITETVGWIIHNGDATIASNFENNGWSLGYGTAGSPTTYGKLRAEANAVSTPAENGLINLGTWVFVLMTVTAGNLWTLYINGVSVASGAGGATRTPTANIEFGISSLWPALYGSQTPLNGDVQESGVWNKVTSAQEISDLYNSGIGQTKVTLTASAGANGAISTPGSTILAYGANQTFTITPDSGYIVSNVFVDGISVGAVSSYTFTNIISNHTIIATFEAFVPIITGSQNGSQLIISWDAVSNAKNYQLERKTPSGDNYEVIATIFDTTYTDNQIFSNTTYNYRLKSIALPGYTNSGYSYLNIRTTNFDGQPQASLLQSQEQPLSNSVRFGDQQAFNEFYFGQPEGSFKTLEKYLPRFIK